jgi:tetratricopeptide (TPR) repeat protein
VIVVSALAALAVAAVAAGFVMRPFRRGNAPLLERLADPLDDDRLALLRSLRDLDEEHAAGTIAEEDYRALRRDTEVRAVAVLKALAARERVSAPPMHELRTVAGNGDGRGRASGPRRAVVPAILVAAAVVAVSVPVLSGALRSRTPGQSITGNDVTGQSSLSFFEQRVRRHPRDVAARLDLAARYRSQGDVQGATGQYLAALRLNPGNAEANAAVGYLLYLSGDPGAGLRYADRSLRADAAYPEGLYVRGVILARGLHRLAQARAALRAYLAAAPYGSHRAEAIRLLGRPSG